MESTNTIIDAINAIIESMGAILKASESGRIPYDVRLETFLREFSVILKEMNMIITTLQEKLTKAENERDSLKLASQNLAHDISAKPAVNENRANYHSYENANLEILHKDLIKNNNSQTDSIKDEFSTPTTWYEPSNLDSAVADAPAKAKQIHPIKSKKNSSWIQQSRNRLPSILRRPTKDWSNHLDLVHLKTTNPPFKDQFSICTTSRVKQTKPRRESGYRNNVKALSMGKIGVFASSRRGETKSNGTGITTK